MKKKLAVAMSLAVLLIGGGGGSAYAYYETPKSYVSLDINPSVELGVNAFGKVVDVKPYNSDGEKILIEIKIKGADVTEAISKLVSSAVNNGYVSEDGSTVVSLTSETDDKELGTELETDAEEGAKEALEESGKTAAINKDNVALARRDEARTLGITPGKLNLINKLQAVDPTATVEQYKDASVKEIMKSIKEARKNGKENNKKQGEDSNVTQSTDSTVNQSQEVDVNQSVENDKNQTQENDKKQVIENDKDKNQDKDKDQDKDQEKEHGEESKKNQGDISNNADNNAKNTSASDNGNNGNKGRK